MDRSVQKTNKYRFSISSVILITTATACAVAVGKYAHGRQFDLRLYLTTINLGLGILFFTLPIVIAYAASSMSRIPSQLPFASSSSHPGFLQTSGFQSWRAFVVVCTLATPSCIGEHTGFPFVGQHIPTIRSITCSFVLSVARNISPGLKKHSRFII